MNFRDYFSLDSQYIHLNNAGFAPITTAAKDKIKDYAEATAQLGFHSRTKIFKDYEKARDIFARFLGTTADRLAFTANLSTSVSILAHGLALRPGETVLTLDQEYPSNAYVWHHVAQKNQAKVKVFKSNPDTTIDWEGFKKEITSEVKVVVISWVQYETGVVAPLKEISEACRSAGAILVADVIQGVGAMPFNMQDLGVDIACGGSHKWICGISGMGYLAFRDDRYLEIQPVLEGAMTFRSPNDLTDLSLTPIASARRFEPGAPLLVNVLASVESTVILEKIGISEICKHNTELSRFLVEGIKDLNLSVMGQKNSEPTSSIVTFEGAPSMEKTAALLVENKISHAFRRGRIRFSPHLFNTIDDLNAVLNVLKETL